MRCEFKECVNLPLTQARYCWGHLADKEAYIAKLAEAIKRGDALTGWNLQKIVLKDGHLEKADLSKANFSQAVLAGSHIFDSRFEGADLVGADMTNCEMTHCDLKGADLTKARLAGARLWNADLEGANLTECDLSWTDLWGAKLFRVKLWHTVFTGAKSITSRSFSGDTGLFKCPVINETGLLSAEESYRDLKSYFMSNGMYNDASWASFKEKTMERMLFKKKRDLTYIPSALMNILCGYGEKPYRIIISALSTIFIYALVYFALNAVECSTAQGYVLRPSDYLYYSAITFTTVGYGDFIPKTNSLFRLLAASEAFIGTFLTGLFIFTLARRYSAR